VRLNSYRQAAGLRPVVNNPKFSDGDLKHAQYLVKNYNKDSPLSGAMHSEDSTNRWYTPEGLQAAQFSDVIPPGGSAFDDEDAIDLWLSGPFHALPMLDPELKETGFGRYCEGNSCAAALRVGRDESWFRNAARLNTKWRSNMSRMEHENPNVYTVGPETRVLSSPVEFPPSGATISQRSFNGGEWPNPLTACPGYKPPTGPVVVLALGTEVNTEVSAHSFTANGSPLEHCIFNAQTYTNSDESQQKAAQGNLKLMGAVVLVPRAQLSPGNTYTVSITAGGRSHSWSFSVRSKALMVNR
jgi:hypothetical protein